MFLAAFTSAFSVKLQAVHRNTAWLWRDSLAACPHAEQRWLVYADGTRSTLPGALSSSRRTSAPQPFPRMPRFSPALAATFTPGACAVPLAERVIFRILRSSTRMTSNRRARSVEVFSHQSLRRLASRAFRRAAVVLALRLRFEPRFA